MRNALVPITPSAPKSEAFRPATRANADFIAHLIAMAAQAPQTRTRRRAEPQQAVAVYRALGQWPTPPGRVVCVSL